MKFGEVKYPNLWNWLKKYEDKFEVIDKKSLSFNSTIDVSFKVEEVQSILRKADSWMAKHKFDGNLCHWIFTYLGTPKSLWSYLVALESHEIPISSNISRGI